jgi:hypothetical protein
MAAGCLIRDPIEPLKNCCVPSVLIFEMVLLKKWLFVCIKANEPLVVLCLIWLLCYVGCLVDREHLGTLVPVGTSEVRLPLTCFCLRFAVETLSWYQHWYWLLVCFRLRCPIWYTNGLFDLLVALIFPALSCYVCLVD